MTYFKRRVPFLLPLIAAALFSFQAAGYCAQRPAAPAPGNYVNDYAGVLDAATVVQLNGALADLDAKAKAQVAVLTVKTLGNEDIDTYAVETYKRWGIGDKKTNRGVLLLVATEDHKARIEVGYGLEGILPDGLTGAIQDKYIIPYFKQGDYSKGVYYGSLALASVIAKDAGVTISAGSAQGGRPARPPMSPAQRILSILLIIGVIIFAIRHPVLAYFILSSMMRSGGGFGGGGFGGFGGGMSGGGGSSRSW